MRVDTDGSRAHNPLEGDGTFTCEDVVYSDQNQADGDVHIDTTPR